MSLLDSPPDIIALMDMINQECFGQHHPRILCDLAVGTQIMSIVRVSSTVAWPAEAAATAAHRMQRTMLDAITTSDCLLNIDPRLPPLCPTIRDTAAIFRRVLPE